MAAKIGIGQLHNARRDGRTVNRSPTPASPAAKERVEFCNAIVLAQTADEFLDRVCRNATRSADPH